MAYDERVEQLVFQIGTIHAAGLGLWLTRGIGKWDAELDCLRIFDCSMRALIRTVVQLYRTGWTRKMCNSGRNEWLHLSISSRI
jgi:hypothetical protein